MAQMKAITPKTVYTHMGVDYPTREKAEAARAYRYKKDLCAVQIEKMALRFDEDRLSDSGATEREAFAQYYGEIAELMIWALDQDTPDV